MKYLSLFLLALSGFSSSVFADNFSVQSGAPTITYSPSLQTYVKTISSYQPETPALNERLQNTIAYYQKVHISKTVRRKDFTIDCIPFAEQPALIDNPILAQSLMHRVKETSKNNFSYLKKMGNFFAFNTATECPFGTVAILRPSIIMLTSENANRKIAPFNTNTTLAAGYTWQQGVTPLGAEIQVPTQADQAFFKGPQNQFVVPGNFTDHSLDQFWLVHSTHHPHLTETFTVEFGIIASGYFISHLIDTSIFVFASIDNYGPNSCYNLQCPNFVQAPGTPPFGVPISNKNTDFIFQVKHIDRDGVTPGYYLTLVAHDPSFGSATTLLGLYPNSLYAPNHRPRFFSEGAEVYATSPFNGTLMYGNAANPYAEYKGEKMIGEFSQNANHFPHSTTTGPSPYDLIWKLGQA